MTLIKIRIAVWLLVSFPIAVAQWLPVPPPVEARMMMVVQGGSSVAGKTYLFQDNFDDTDGTNLATRSGWAGSNVDNIEIDTAQYYAGTASVKRNGTDTNLCYATFTKQTTGKHTYDFYVRFATVTGGSTTDFFGTSDGVYNYSSNNWNTFVGRSSQDLMLWTGGGWTTLQTNAFVGDTWYHIEIEYDMDNNTVNVWLDGTQKATNTAFQNNADPDRINFSDFTNSSDVWIDSLQIYTGARQ